jgi:hypothetical protein
LLWLPSYHRIRGKISRKGDSVFVLPDAQHVAGGCQQGTKSINNHQFLRYGSPFYDPSYGLEYTGEAGVQTTAIAGHSADIGFVGGAF